MEDRELVSKAVAGDVGAFEQLIAEYQQRVYSTVLNMVKNPSRAEDIAQEVFVRAFKTLSGFRQESNFYTWLYRIIRYTIVDEYRRSYHTQKETSLDEAYNVSDNFADPGTVIYEKEVKNKLREAIFLLPLDFRMVIVLCDLENMSYEDASEVIKKPIGTVRSRLHRGRGMLKDILIQKYGNFFREFCDK